MSIFVDVVIPVSSPNAPLTDVLESLIPQSENISTIYFIVSGCGPILSESVSFTRDSLSHHFSEERKEFKGLSLCIMHFSCRLYPGAARNVGLLFSTASYIGFLDVNTNPGCDWLSSFESHQKLQSSCVSMIGTTRYHYQNYFQKIIIAASYSFYPLRTVPGSIISRQALGLVGFFAPNWRAGEDLDFLARLNSLFPCNFISTVPNTYIMRSSNILYYLLKWVRNYSDSVPYQKVVAQSHALTLLFAAFISMLAFNWNWMVASWNESDPLYFANITKYILSSFVFIYVLLRGIFLPIKKGALMSGRCNILDLLLILLVSILFDLAKTLGFLFHPLLGSKFSKRITKSFRDF